MKIDESIERMRKVLSQEQTAKFLILMEKFKSKEEFSIFNLWNIKKQTKENSVLSTLRFSKGQSQK